MRSFGFFYARTFRYDVPMPVDPAQRRFQQLAQVPQPRDSDLSLGFLKEQFKKEIARPMKQLGELAAIWDELLPDD